MSSIRYKVNYVFVDRNTRQESTSFYITEETWPAVGEKIRFSSIAGEKLVRDEVRYEVVDVEREIQKFGEVIDEDGKRRELSNTWEITVRLMEVSDFM